METPEFLASRIDQLGTPEAYNHFSVGWAHAMDTPYQWTKQVASHWGGTRNGTIVHWPKGIAAQGEVRHQLASRSASHRPSGGGRTPASDPRERHHIAWGESMRRCDDGDFEIGGNRGATRAGPQ